MDALHLVNPHDHDQDRDVSILVVDDDDVVLRAVGRRLSRSGFRPLLAGNAAEALAIANREEIELALIDRGLPDLDGLVLLQRLQDRDASLPCFVFTGSDDLSVAEKCFEAGARDYFPKPLNDWPRFVGRLHRAAGERGQRASETVQDSVTRALTGQHPAMVRLRTRVRRFAPLPMPVLILGESGAGKSLVARALHDGYSRSGEFVALNAANLNPQFLESELFGFSKGAFSGAVADKPGLFEVAQNGTLFLDEVAEVPFEHQAKLLTVLDHGEFRRVNDTRRRKSNARVVCATNRDLKAEVAAGRFRSDLYYRLTRLVLPIPPLRDRLDDIPELAYRFLEGLRVKLPTSQVRQVGSGVFDALLRHSWPGNVRELEGVLETAVVNADGERLELHHLAEELRHTPAPAEVQDVGRVDPAIFDLPYREFKDAVLHAYTVRYLERLLEVHDQNVTKAAMAAGEAPANFRRRLRRYGVRKS